MSGITATGANSQLNGTVEIIRPDYDPASGLIKLPVNIVDRSGQIAQRCPANHGNKFIITGRGGLPISPEDLLQDVDTLTSWINSENSVIYFRLIIQQMILLHHI